MRWPAAVLSVFLVLAAGDARAGFDEGVAAYKRSDYAAALREWRPLAEQGHADARGGLGLMCFKGQGVPQDFVGDWEVSSGECRIELPFRSGEKR